MSTAADRVRGSLTDKYRRLIALREARDAGGEPPSADLRALASAHPGALRELDRAPLGVLRERLMALAGPLPPWAAPSYELHEALRIALEIRRLAGRSRDRSAALEAARRHRLSERDMSDILSPPRGRLAVWAVARVARHLGMTPEFVEHWTVGHLRPLPPP